MVLFMDMSKWQKKPVYNREGHLVGESKYAITDGDRTIAKFYNGEKLVYRVSRGREFIGCIYESAKKAEKSTSDINLLNLAKD